MLKYYIGFCSSLAVINTIGYIRGSSDFMAINNHSTWSSAMIQKERERIVATRLRDNIFNITMFPVIYIIGWFA